jgi:hypothetical protein
MKGRVRTSATNTSDRLGRPDCYLRCHTPRPNRTALPNPHPRKDDRVPTKLAVLSHVDLLAKLRAFGAVPQGGVEQVGARVETAIRAHKSPSAHSDWAGVDEGGVEVEEDAGAKLDVAAIVGVDWGVYSGFRGEE